jgi:hypothetical protein
MNHDAQIESGMTAIDGAVHLAAKTIRDAIVKRTREIKNFPHIPFTNNHWEGNDTFEEGEVREHPGILLSPLRRSGDMSVAILTTEGVLKYGTTITEFNSNSPVYPVISEKTYSDKLWVRHGRYAFYLLFPRKIKLKNGKRVEVEVGKEGCHKCGHNFPPEELRFGQRKCCYECVPFDSLFAE